MNTNKKLFLHLGIVMLMSIASLIKSHDTQEEWQNLLPQTVKKIILDLNPDLQETINFLAWQPHHRLQGHNDDQAGLSIAVADDIIVTASGKKFAKVWDKNTYKKITELQVHIAVTSVAIADSIIVTGLGDGSTKVWDRNGYKEIATLKGHNGEITAVAIADNIIVTGSRDKTAKVWDRNSYKEIATLTGHNESIASVAVADDTIVTASWDKTAKVWNKVWYWNSYKETTTLKVGSPVTSVAIADGIIVTGSFYEPTKLWDKNTYKEIGTLRRSVTSVAVADDIILTGSDSGIITVHDSKPFVGTVENNPLLWILSHATLQQWDFIEQACEHTQVQTMYGQERYIYVSQKFSEIQKENEWQSESNGRIYFSFPEAVQQYLHNRLNISILS